MRIVDLSFPIRPHFRWKVEPKLVRSHAAGDVFQSTVLTVACHAYTHVDAPVHFLPGDRDIASMPVDQWIGEADRKSTRLNSSHGYISYAVFCLKKKKNRLHVPRS